MLPTSTDTPIGAASPAADQDRPAHTAPVPAQAPPVPDAARYVMSLQHDDTQIMPLLQYCTGRQGVECGWGRPPPSNARSEAGTRSAGAGASAAPSSRSMPVPSAHRRALHQHMYDNGRQRTVRYKRICLEWILIMSARKGGPCNMCSGTGLPFANNQPDALWDARICLCSTGITSLLSERADMRGVHASCPSACTR